MATVVFNLSLTFLQPSTITNMKAVVQDERMTTFNLIGDRSCDPFKFCITGRNVLGQGDLFCDQETLPYVPHLESISFSMSKSERNFIVSVNVTVS